jgi:hypothetical protein
MIARPDGIGNEIEGITRQQIERYSSRTQEIDAHTQEAAQAWARKYGREPNRRELLYIRQEVTMATRERKPEQVIDWDKLAEQWEAKWDGWDGTALAQVASGVSDLRGPEGPSAQPGKAQPRGLAPDAGAQMRAMQQALARVQAAHTTWTRADLMREMAASLSAEAHQMPPAEAVALLHDLTDRSLAGEAEQVICLDAPEWPSLPDYLRRDLDGRSIYTRPGTSRYATQVQMSSEEQLLATAAREAAPHLTPELSARMLGAAPEALETAGRQRGQEASAQLPSGVRMGQAAALHAALTDPRTVYVIVGPAGSGKTHTLAQAARMWREAGMGDVVGTAPSQAARNVLADAAQIPAYNTARFLGHHPDKGRGALGAMAIRPGTLVILDEGSMTSIEDIRDLAAHAAANGSKLLVAGDQSQLTAVEGGGGMGMLTREFEHAQLAEPIRFTAEWEGEASLRLRTGDAAVLTEYDPTPRT